jgi:hypothetical protein
VPSVFAANEVSKLSGVLPRVNYVWNSLYVFNKAPALFTRISILVQSRRETRDLIDEGRERSHNSSATSLFPVSSTIFFTASVPEVSLRQTRVTFAFRLDSSRATTYPRPELAPVMTLTLEFVKDTACFPERSEGRALNDCAFLRNAV